MNRSSEKCSSITLTPALSLRERENHSPRNVQSAGDDCRNVSRHSRIDQLLFPLPQGAGQGEGDRRN